MRVDVIKSRAFKASLLRFTTFRGGSSRVMVPRESARPVESQKSSGGKGWGKGLSSSNPIENSRTRISGDDLLRLEERREDDSISHFGTRGSS